MTPINLTLCFISTFQYYLQVLPYSVKINIFRTKFLFFPTSLSFKKITSFFFFFPALRSTILPLIQGQNFGHL